MHVKFGMVEMNTQTQACEYFFKSYVNTINKKSSYLFITVTVGVTVSLAKKPRYPMDTIILVSPPRTKISLLVHLMRHTAENQL